MASGQFRKQDVSLIFGLQGGGSLSGESGALIKGQLETIVKRLNNSKDKSLQVALNLNVAQTKSNFKTALNDKVIPALQSQKASISLTLDKIDASSAIQNIKEELKNVLNSLSIKNGVRIEDLIDLTKDAQGVRALTDEEKRRLENLNALRKALNSTYNGAVKVASPEGLNNLERHQKDLQSLIKLMQEYASGIRNMSTADAQSGYDSLVKMAYELQKNLEIEKQGLSVEKQVTLEQEKQNRLLTEESSLILASNEATKKYGQSIKSAYDNLKTKAKTDADLSAITSIMTGSKENQEWFQINAELQKGVVLEESRRAQFVATGEVIRSQIEALNGLVTGQKAATSEFNASKIAVENLGGSVETLYKSMLKNASTTQDVGKIRAKLLQYKDLLEQIENIKSGNASYTNNEYYEIGKRIIALREELNILQQQLSTYDAVDQATKSVGQSVMNMYNGMLRGVSTDKELEKILAVSSQYSDWFKTEYALQNGLVQLTDEQARSHAKVGLEVKRVLSGLKEETAEYAKQNTLMKESARTSLANQIKGYISANPLVKNSREYGLLQKYYADLTSGQNMSESDGNNIAQAFSSIQAQMRTAKLEGNQLSTQLKDIFKQVTGFYSLATVVRKGYEQLRKMANAVKEIDTAMTELRKVTDETEVTYDKFLKNAAKRAKELGATVAETTNATADFARLGYDIEGAEALANTAIVYKNVGDGIKDISEASESIISTLQAFGIEAENAMSIVDKFNEVGNNFAISSQGIGEALLRSASALAAAGNTIDESIAMIAATNEVVQSPEKVGNALKTVSMYLRSSKVELEEAGESTEGMAESVSKLRDSILGLTGGEVDIQIDKDTYKGAYEIIAELSRVWDKISDINQAGILELIGGKILPQRTVMCA